IDEWLEGDVKARRKQRHTAKRVYDRLCAEVKDFGCSYRTVASSVKEKKHQIDAGIRAALPLEHKAGEAQVDFGSAD
ncbi:IS21 family transposase, partial [Klebsiella pneumoniae]|nr:IS21 family transposase [Klebsiella pneumoniae]